METTKNDDYAIYTAPIPETDEDGKTYWRYRDGGYIETPENGGTYGRCGTKKEAEQVIASFSQMNAQGQTRPDDA